MKLYRRTPAASGAIVLLLCVALGGCGKASSPVRDTEPAAGGAWSEADETPVAVVDGSRIALREVRELVRRSALSSREALDRLVAERLLMQEARRRGFADVAEVRHVGEQAAVQAVLIEEADSLAVAEEELRKAYEAAHDRFHVPEKRETIHLLVRMPADAAPELSRAGEAVAGEAVDALAYAGVEEAARILEQLRGQHGADFKIRVEKLPPFGRTGRLVKEYEDAMFELSEAGVVPRPVRTRFGWHAIYLTAIHPEQHWSFEEAAGQLRAEILLEKRKKRMEVFFDRLRTNADIQTDESAVEWLLQARLSVLDRR